MGAHVLKRNKGLRFARKEVNINVSRSLPSLMIRACWHKSQFLSSGCRNIDIHGFF